MFLKDLTLFFFYNIVSRGMCYKYVSALGVSGCGFCGLWCRRSQGSSAYPVSRGFAIALCE